MSLAYYNEIDPYAAQWLRNLMGAGLIPLGVVDERDVRDVRPHELEPYTQCHFFAGLGGWPLALRMAGWDDDREVWTGSCPCQPFSAAGRRLGFSDERDLWPSWHWIIEQRRPSVVFGEQVASKDGLVWLSRSRDDMEGAGYAFGAGDLPACGVEAPQKRSRIFFVADSDIACASEERERRGGQRGRARSDQAGGAVGDANGLGRQQAGYCGHFGDRGAGEKWKTHRIGDANPPMGSAGSAGSRVAAGERCDARAEQQTVERAGWCGAWSDAEWLFDRAKGVNRRVKPGVRLLAHGVPARVAKLRALGNAIVPQIAAEFIIASGLV